MSDTLIVAPYADEHPIGGVHVQIQNLQQVCLAIFNSTLQKPLIMTRNNLFDGLKRITLNRGANANADLIEYAWKNGYLFSEKEYSFLKSTMKKRNLSSNQISWKIKINNRILKGTVVRRRTVRD